MLRSNFEGGEAVMWCGDVYEVLNTDVDLVAKGDGDDVCAFAVALDDGSILFEDDSDTCELVVATVFVPGLDL